MNDLSRDISDLCSYMNQSGSDTPGFHGAVTTAGNGFEAFWSCLRFLSLTFL